MQMKRRVIIVGTHHLLQMRNPKRPDGEYPITEEDRNTFKKKIIEWCQKEGALGIAEEMNDDALKRHSHCPRTVPQEVARVLDLCHQHSDMDEEQRKALKFQIEAAQMDPAREEIRTLRDKLQDGIRERYWIKELIVWDCFPVLFVCGWKHVDSFREELERHGFETKIAAEKYVPTAS